MWIHGKTLLGGALLAFALGAFSQPAMAADQEALKQKALDVIHAIDEALEARDAEGLLKHFAPQMSLRSVGCGEPPSRLSRKEFAATVRQILPLMKSYESTRTGVVVTVLGDGRVITVRSRHREIVSGDGFEFDQDNHEAYYLERTKKGYIVTSVASREVCS